jgi:DNA-binding MarR family transcriptional regulator
VERRADPEDGRATLLVPTAKADAILHEQNDIRLQHFARMLSDWSEADLRTFAELLQRFTKDYDSASTNWLLDRVAAGRSSAKEGTS